MTICAINRLPLKAIKALYSVYTKYAFTFIISCKYEIYKNEDNKKEVFIDFLSNRKTVKNNRIARKLEAL